MPPKRTRKARLGIYRTQIPPLIRPCAISRQSVSRYHRILQDIGTIDKASDWLIANLGAVAKDNLHKIHITR